jgi:transcriptional regulator with XRE-family HTH domain
MITGRQIRAARALLNMDAVALAEDAGLSRDTITGLEQGSRRPHKGSLAKIIRVFTQRGVEFIENRGVAMSRDIITIFEGDKFYLKFLDHVFTQMNGTNGEVLFINVDDSLSSPETVAANKRMQAAGIPCRYLCRERPTRLDFPKKCYRAIPDEYFRNGVLVVFGDYFATLVRDQFVQVIRNADTAGGVRALFEVIWGTHKMPQEPKNA